MGQREVPPDSSNRCGLLFVVALLPTVTMQFGYQPLEALRARLEDSDLNVYGAVHSFSRASRRPQPSQEL